jgi:hypothetical protein
MAIFESSSPARAATQRVGPREAGVLSVEPVQVRDAKRRRAGVPENLIFRGRVCIRPSRQATLGPPELRIKTSS